MSNANKRRTILEDISFVMREMFPDSAGMKCSRRISDMRWGKIIVNPTASPAYSKMPLRMNRKNSILMVDASRKMPIARLITIISIIMDSHSKI